MFWDRVECAEHEDMNSTFFDVTFGSVPCEASSGNLLYDVRTVCTFTPSKSQDVSLDSLSASGFYHSTASEDGHLCVSLGGTVIKLSALSGKIDTVAQFDCDVDCLALSDDGDFLFVGCVDGMLSVIYAPDNKNVLSQRLLQDKDDDSSNAFSNIICTPADGVHGTCSILVFLSSGITVQFNDVRLKDLAIAIVENRDSEIKEILLGIAKSRVHNINYKHTSLVSGFRKNAHLLAMSDQMNLLRLLDYSPKCTLCWESVMCGKPTKVEVTSDGRFAILLDDRNFLHVVCLRVFVVVKRWKSCKIVDFTLMETILQKSLDIKLVMLVDSECSGRLFQIRDFPSFKLQHTVKANPFTFLLKIPANQDSIFFLEGDYESKSKLVIVKIRQVTEALPEARLSRLLTKCQFDDAVAFAVKYGLDQQSIFCAKANWLFEQLPCERSSNSSQADIAAAKAELFVCLDKIVDINMVIRCCYHASLPTLQCTIDVLLYAISRMNGMKIADDGLQYEVFQKLQKSETFESIFGHEQFRDEFQNFMDADLLAVLFRYLSIGRMDVVSVMWERHRDHMARAMTVDQVMTFLETGAVATNLPEFNNWICLSFASSMLITVPECLDQLMKWTIHTCLTMELKCKKEWPDVAIRFAQKMDSVFRDHCSKTTVPRCSELKKFSNNKAIGSQLQTLINMLCDLKKLRDCYRCKISLADFSQEDKGDVCVRLLKWIDDREEIAKFVANFLRPFAKRNGLNMDEVLNRYVKYVTENTDFGCWHREPAPWEHQIIAIVECIRNVEVYLNCVVCVLHNAPIPWSSHIEKLAQRSLDLNHSLSKNVRVQMDTVRLKTVLAKYGLHRYNVTNCHSAWIAVNRIVKLGGESAIEDALAVGTSSLNVGPVDVHLIRIRFLISSNRHDDFISLLKSLPPALAVVSCQRTVSFIKDLLWNKRWSELAPVERSLFLRAVLHVLNHLRGLVNSTDFEEYCDLFDKFSRMRALQNEFHAIVTLKDLSSEDRCVRIFHENVLSLLDRGTLSDNFKTDNAISLNLDERKTGKCVFTISWLFRLSSLLKLKRETSLATIATEAVLLGKIDVVFTVLKEISTGCIDADSSVILLDFMFDFLQRLDELLSAMESESLVELMSITDRVVSRVSTYCDPGLLERCADLSHSVNVLRGLAYSSSNLEPSNSQSSLVLRNVDPYRRWLFSPLYLENVFPVDVGLVLSSVTHSLDKCFEAKRDVDERQTGVKVFMKKCETLIQHVSRRGHKCFAYCILNGAVGIILKHGFSNLLLSTNSVFDFKRMHILDILNNVFSQRRLDTDLALGLLLSLTSHDAIRFLGGIEKRCGRKYRELLSLAEVGCAFCTIAGMTGDSIIHFTRMAKHASWGIRLSQCGIDMKETKSALTDEIVMKPGLPFTLLRDYCDDFQLNFDAVMVSALVRLFLVDRIDLKRATRILGEINNDLLLLETLKSAIEKVDDYNYEVISFVLENMKRLASSLKQQDIVNSCKNNLYVLDFLKLYKRVSKPSEFESFLRRPITALNKDSDILTQTRLPFHALLSADAEKVICPELTPSNVDVWLKMVPYITKKDVSTKTDDILLVNAARNLVLNAVDRSHVALALTDERSDFDMVDEIFALLRRVSDLEMANASANFVIRRLPQGNAKIAAVKSAVTLAQAWWNGTESPRAANAVQVFSSMYVKLTSEYILREASLDRPEYLSLCGDPRALIAALYHDSSVVDRFWFRPGYYPDIHEACKDIARDVECDLDAVFFELLEKWLTPTQCDGMDFDETMILNVGARNVSGHFRDDEQSSIVNEDNLKRAIYLMELGSEVDNATHVAKLLLSNVPVISAEHKFRAAMCLLHSVSEDSIERCTSMTRPQLVKLAKSLFCASQLEALHLPPCDVNLSDDTTGVHDLIYQLLQIAFGDTRATELAADMCTESNIRASNIWCTILQQMMDAKLYDKLSRTLACLPDIAGVEWVPIVAKAWTFILEAPIASVESTAMDRIILFHRCPVLLHMDLKSLCDTFDQMGLPVLAFDCLMHITDPVTQEECIRAFATRLERHDIVNQLTDLRELYGNVYHLDRVKSRLDFLSHNS